MYGESTIMSTGTYTDEQVKLSTDNKTTLPKQARKFLDAEKGDTLSFKITEDERVVVEIADEAE